MPVFFGMAGLSADLTVLNDPELALLTLGLIAIASVGKFAGAFIGGEIGGLHRREALALACGMNARGSTEVIVATIGLSMGVLSQNLFTMIVAMAVITTMAMPPMLRWALSRVPMSEEEKERLEREEFEAKGFVPNLERLLVAVDDSPNGKFAARLAGLIAGPRGDAGDDRATSRRARHATGGVAARPAPRRRYQAKRLLGREPGTPHTRRHRSMSDAAAQVGGLTDAVRARSEATATIWGCSVGAHGSVAEQAVHDQVTQTADGFHGPLAIVVPAGPTPWKTRSSYRACISWCPSTARPMPGVPVRSHWPSRAQSQASITALYVLPETANASPTTAPGQASDLAQRGGSGPQAVCRPGGPIRRAGDNRDPDRIATGRGDRAKSPTRRP